MKIGIDGIPLSQPKTGVGHYTFEIARGLAVAYPDDQISVVSHLPFVDTSLSTTSENISFIHAPVNSLSKHWWTMGLPRYIRNNSIDLFHGTNYDIPVWSGRPTVLTIHDLSLFLFAETHETRRVKRARRRLPLMSRLATRIIVPTESVRKEVCEHLPVKPEKVAVVHEAPRSCFQPGSPANNATLERLGVEDSFVLYVGTIEPRKNLLTLVRAFQETYEKTSLRPQLVIVGPTGWLSDDLFAYVEQSGVKERMLLTGYLGDEDLRVLYSTCSVMCYPALYEGAGLPPLEAMACGAPVITSDASAVVEMVGDGARSVPARDHQKLAAAIVELFSDHTSRAKLVELGLRRVRQFTWERAVEGTYKIYLEAIEAR